MSMPPTRVLVRRAGPGRFHALHGIAAAGLFGLLTVHGAKAAMFDAVAQFSLASNPNGVWSYGYGTPGSTFTAFTSTSNAWGGYSGLAAWSATPNTLPAIGINTANSTRPLATTVEVPTGVLWMQSGDSDAGAAILEFKAPTAGQYQVSGSFERLDTTNLGDGVGVSVYQNSSPLVARSVIPPTTYLSQSSFSTFATLMAGDVLSFVEDRNGDYRYDTTGLAVTVTSVSAVPEPPSLILLSAGVIFVMGSRQTRRMGDA